MASSKAKGASRPPLHWFYLGDTYTAVSSDPTRDECGASRARTSVFVQKLLHANLAKLLDEETGDGTNPPGILGVLKATINDDRAVGHSYRWGAWPESIAVLVRRFPRSANQRELLLEKGKLIVPWPFLGATPNDRRALDEKLGNHKIKRYTPSGDEIYLDSVMRNADQMLMKDPEARELLEAAKGNDKAVKAFLQFYISRSKYPYGKALPKHFSVSIKKKMLSTETQIKVRKNGSLQLQLGWIEVQQFADWPCGAG